MKVERKLELEQQRLAEEKLARIRLTEATARILQDKITQVCE